MFKKIISIETELNKIFKNKSWFASKRMDVDKEKLLSSKESERQWLNWTNDMVMGEKEKKNFRYWKKYWEGIRTAFTVKY